MQTKCLYDVIYVLEAERARRHTAGVTRFSWHRFESGNCDQMQCISNEKYIQHVLIPNMCFKHGKIRYPRELDTFFRLSAQCRILICYSVHRTKLVAI